MAMTESGQLDASLQDTAVHTDSNPGAPRSNTSKKGQEEAGSVSGERAAHRPVGA
jgi:hypothetical protein